MNLKEIGSKRDSLAAKYKWGLMALVALLVSPIIFLIVKGLVGLAIAAVVGIGIVSAIGSTLMLTLQSGAAPGTPGI